MHQTHKNLRSLIRTRVEKFKSEHEKAKKQKEKVTTEELKKQKAQEEAPKIENLINQSEQSVNKKEVRFKDKFENASARSNDDHKKDKKDKGSNIKKQVPIQNQLDQDGEG